MINQLKTAPLIWKLIAFVGLPCAALFSGRDETLRQESLGCRTSRGRQGCLD
jgi:hypothetical protein